LIEVAAPEDLPSLAISPEKVCHVVALAREFEGADESAAAESGADPSEERMAPALAEEEGQDPAEDELIAFIGDMSEDEQIDLVALAWLGRGDGTIEDWDDIRQQAADAHNDRTAAYLLGIPLLPDYLEDGLAAFGRSCEELGTEVA
jgi:hypothetical protein